MSDKGGVSGERTGAVAQVAGSTGRLQERLIRNDFFLALNEF